MVTNSASSNGRNARDLHLVIGSGGTKAILGGTGAVVALYLAGLEFKTIGGASGGTIPASLFASGMTPASILRLAIETEFSSLLTPRSGLVGRIWALVNKYRYEVTRPARGVYSTEKLAALMDRTVPFWPERFWCVSSCRHGQVIFTAAGADKYEVSGLRRTLATSPPRLGTAISASCAMPGIMDAPEFHGEHLFDGALSGDGQCPVEPVVRHFGGDYKQITAVDIEEDEAKKNWWIRQLWHVACGGSCDNIYGTHPDESTGVVVIKPIITGFNALNFSIGAYEKWRGIVTGFTATVARLEAAGVLNRTEHEHLFRLFSALEAIPVSTTDTLYVSTVEALFRANGCY